MKDDLLSATTINPSQNLLQQGLIGEEAPETGLFDFTSYLLGLQESSVDLIQPEGAGDLPMTGFLPETQESDNPLLKVFDKANREMWNPLFPAQNDVAPLSNMGSIDTNSQISSRDQQTQKLMVNNPTLESLANGGEIKSPLRKESAKTDPSEKVAEFLSLDKLQKSDEQETIDRDIAVERYSPPVEEKTIKLGPKQEEITTQKVTVKEKVHDENNPVVQTQVSKNEHVIEEKKKDFEELKPKSVNSEGHHAFGLSGLQNKVSTAPMTAQAIEGQSNASNLRHSVPEVFQRVESMIHQGGGKMTVLLTPPELGQVEIKIQARGKQIEVQVKSENEFAKHAIESGVEDLKNSMQVKDLHLAKFEVQVGERGHMGFEQDRWAHQMAQGDSSNPFSSHSQQSRGDGTGNRSARYQKVVDVIEASRPNPSALRTGGIDRGRVDIRI